MGIAYSSDITQVFTKTGEIYFAGSGQGTDWDRHDVATLFLNPWDPTIAYYQGWINPVTDIPIGVANMLLY
jgi:hypothetical protein